MANLNPWSPVVGSTVSLAVSAGSARVALFQTLDGSVNKVKLSTDAEIFIKFGDSTVTATTANDAYPAGVQVISAAPGSTHVAAITASGTATARFGLGYGI